MTPNLCFAPGHPSSCISDTWYILWATVAPRWVVCAYKLGGHRLHWQFYKLSPTGLQNYLHSPENTQEKTFKTYIPPLSGKQFSWWNSCGASMGTLQNLPIKARHDGRLIVPVLRGQRQEDLWGSPASYPSLTEFQTSERHGKQCDVSWRMAPALTSASVQVCSQARAYTCIHYIIITPYTQTYTPHFPKPRLQGGYGPWFLSSSVVFLMWSFHFLALLCRTEVMMGSISRRHKFFVMKGSLALGLWGCLTICGSFEWACSCSCCSCFCFELAFWQRLASIISASFFKAKNIWEFQTPSHITNVFIQPQSEGSLSQGSRDSAYDIHSKVPSLYRWGMLWEAIKLPSRISLCVCRERRDPALESLLEDCLHGASFTSWVSIMDSVLFRSSKHQKGHVRISWVPFVKSS